MNTDDLTDLIHRDLRLLDELLRWAWHDGHWATNATPSRPRTTTPALAANDTSPDHVRGPRYDIATGTVDLDLIATSPAALCRFVDDLTGTAPPMAAAAAVIAAGPVHVRAAEKRPILDG